jgi:hypothetical protein
MATAKIEIRLGAIDFKGEGEEKWLENQLDKILQQAPELIKVAPMDEAGKNNDTEQETDSPKKAGTITLAKFITDKNVGANQVKRFLTTAVWLFFRGNKKPTTSDVTKALKDNHQARLSNPAESLNKNVKKGYCEKDGKQFFITPDGFKSL